MHTATVPGKCTTTILVLPGTVLGLGEKYCTYGPVEYSTSTETETRTEEVPVQLLLYDSCTSVMRITTLNDGTVWIVPPSADKETTLGAIAAG